MGTRTDINCANFKARSTMYLNEFFEIFYLTETPQKVEIIKR